MKKRLRPPVTKPGQLRAYWGRSEPGAKPTVIYTWGAGGACKADGRILMTALEEAKVFGGKSLVQELEARGYDLSTLRFTIEMKKDGGETSA